MKFRTALLLLIVAYITANSLPAFAMPPLKGRVEPAYPAGVNIPAILPDRDDPDLEGEWNCLIILIDFPDYTWDNRNDTNFSNDGQLYTAEHFESMLFSDEEFAHPGSQSDYTGSMRDYYNEISAGVFTVTGVVTRWYRAPNNYSYYCNQDGETGTEDDHGFGEYPNNAQGLVRDAVNRANADVDFSQFDNNGDDEVDALFVIHAGPGAEEFGDAGASYIWSHKWQIPNRQVDGVTVSEYTIEPENGTIGVFCHEFGHALGLPDLYDTDGSSEGIGEWGLMGGGGWGHRPGDPAGTCPSHMCGWSKNQLEWVTVVNIDADVQEIPIEPVEINPTVYRIWRNGNIGGEYFLLENRQQIGFDAGLTRRQIDYDLPAPRGLLITHIDDAQNRNDEDNHRLVDVEEASPVRLDQGVWLEHLDGDRIRPADLSLYNPNRGDDGDLWPGYFEISEDSTHWTGQRSKTRFGINTIPSSAGYSGEPSLVEVSSLRFDGDNILCDITLSAPDAPLLTLGEVELSDGENGNNVFEPGDTLTLTPSLRNIGQRPARDATLTLTYSGEFEVLVLPAGAVAYPDIDSDAEAQPRVPFTVFIPGDAPPDARIVLDGTATCADQLEFPISVTISLRPAGEWIKSARNPVLSGTPGAWDAGGIGSIDIIDYSDSLVAYYFGVSEIGVSGIGRAVSFDQGESWTKYPDPVIPRFNQGWATGGLFGIGLTETPAGFMMMIGGFNEDDVAAIGGATSDNGLDWGVSDNAVITAGGWCTGIFPIGQIDLFRFGILGICAYGGMTEGGFLAVGASRSMDLIDWVADQQPTLNPTGSQGDFDGFGCFSPDMYFGDNGVQVIYSGVTEDFLPRLGLIDVIDDQNYQRHEGTETGGSILEADADGWEEGGVVTGARMFAAPDGKRLLYVVMNEQGAAVGLATAGQPQTVPGDKWIGTTLMPKAVSLGSAFPNPFNGLTVIPFTISQAGSVVVSIYDLSGRMVLTEKLGSFSTGEYSYNWDTGSNVAGGLYIVELKTEFGTAKGRVLLLK